MVAFGFYSQANIFMEVITLQKLPCKDFDCFPGLFIMQIAAISQLPTYSSVPFAIHLCSNPVLGINEKQHFFLVSE